MAKRLGFIDNLQCKSNLLQPETVRDRLHEISNMKSATLSRKTNGKKRTNGSCS